VPQAIAGCDREIIGRIGARFDADLATVSFGVPPTESEERAGQVRAGAEGPGSPRPHPGQAVKAAATDEMKEHGLRLVVHGVADGNAGRASGQSVFAEKRVAETARRILEGMMIPPGACPHIAGAGDEGDAECGGDRRHEAGIVLGFSAGSEHVVEVGNGEVDLEFGSKPLEDNEQGSRVGAAGDADEDMLAGREDSAFADVVQYAAF